MTRFRSREWRTALIALHEWWKLAIRLGVKVRKPSLGFKETYDSKQFRVLTIELIGKLGATGCVLDHSPISDLHSRVVGMYEPGSGWAVNGSFAELRAAELRVTWFVTSCRAIGMIKNQDAQSQCRKRRRRKSEAIAQFLKMVPGDHTWGELAALWNDVFPDDQTSEEAMRKAAKRASEFPDKS